MKKIFFIASLLGVASVSAQTFKLMDHNDVDIANTTHYEYGTLATLPLSKFHVENLTGASASFAISAEKEYVPYSNSDFQACFGALCFSVSAGLSGPQLVDGGNGVSVAGGANYTDLKMAPVTWPWVNGVADSAVWNVVVFKEGASTDSVAARIIWKFRLTGDINQDGVIGVGEVAGDLDENGMIDGSEVAGDVTGDGVIGDGEVVGDLNGNGVHDQSEWSTSVDDFGSDNIQLSAYPNPASDNVSIKYDVKGGSENVVLNVYDVLGQEIVSRNLDSVKGVEKIDVRSMNSGVYFYAIKVAEKTVRTERFIVR